MLLHKQLPQLTSSYFQLGAMALANGLFCWFPIYYWTTYTPSGDDRDGMVLIIGLCIAFVTWCAAPIADFHRRRPGTATNEHPTMKTKATFKSRVATVLLLAIVAVQVGCGHSKSRCAVEGQAAVEAYLRAGAGGAFTNYGAFIRLEGSGFGGAVWNIQGYDYIKLQRTAYYSGGSFPMMIYVTEGRVTAPGLKTIGIPKIQSMSPVQGAFIYISHPDLR